MRKARKIVVILLGALGLFTSHFSISGADPPETYDAEGIYAHAEKSVFYVRAFRADGTLQDVGTGFTVGQDGTALTAYHVIGGAGRIACVWNDGTVAETCSVIAQDETTDVAVLKLAPSGHMSGQADEDTPLELRSSQMKHGEKMFAIGYPMKETKIITEGIVNSPRAPINGRDRMLISAQIVSGMSGGPVLDKYGKVAGLISGSLRTMNNIHLVVSAQDIRKVMTDSAYKVKDSAEMSN
ncbi:serine protease [Paenibacillus sp. HWE-109]|uniref:S1 family peptidase n=1 Tax=Paenibacillus sp. HWE-109 TaxID=1306526 RepID=UPI001EDF0F78|nr:serine protease [Paenibacillus sp. HWE-109]UKS27098.1 serine protease [Paenibacillus sp. HWE-109]